MRLLVLIIGLALAGAVKAQDMKPLTPEERRVIVDKGTEAGGLGGGGGGRGRRGGGGGAGGGGGGGGPPHAYFFFNLKKKNKLSKYG